MSHKESFLQYLQTREAVFVLHTVRSYLNDLDQFYAYFCHLKTSARKPCRMLLRTIYRAWIVSMLDNNYTTVQVYIRKNILFKGIFSGI